MARRPNDTIDRAVDGIERLQSAYSLERKVFLGGVVVGFMLLVFLVVMSAFGKIEKQDLAILFGPSGIFLGMSGGAMIYFNKSLQIVHELAKEKRDG